jgi:hypothetical protein
MQMPQVRGRVAYIFEEADFDVDQIIGVKNIKLKDPAELAAVAMKEQDPDFAKKVQIGDVQDREAVERRGHRLTLDDGDLASRTCQAHRGRKACQARTHDHDVVSGATHGARSAGGDPAGERVHVRPIAWLPHMRAG